MSYQLRFKHVPKFQNSGHVTYLEGWGWSDSGTTKNIITSLIRYGDNKIIPVDSKEWNDQYLQWTCSGRSIDTNENVSEENDAKMASLRSRCRAICHCHRTGRRSRRRARAAARGMAALPAVHDVATARAANTLFLIGGRLPSSLHLFRTASTTRSFVISMALHSLSLCLYVKLVQRTPIIKF